MNATRHGLVTRSVVLPGIERVEEWEKVRSQLAGERAARVEREARRRIARAGGMAAIGPEVEQVRRHEAHLQRQLAGVLGMLEGLRAPRAVIEG